MSRTKLTTSLARWSATHPWRALLVWVLFVAAAVGVGSAITPKEISDADYRIGQSGRADEMLEQAGLDSPTTENVLITSVNGPIDRSAAEQAAAQLAHQMAEVEGVAGVEPFVWSADKESLLLPIELVEVTPDKDVDVGPLLDVTASVQDAHPQLKLAEVGDTSLDDAINERVGDDLAKAETLSLPITLIIMLIAFGALIAAGIPVLLAISGVLATIALYSPISHLVPGTDTVSSMVLLIGMAVGVDYSLFYLKRAREEREKGRSVIDAVEIAAQTSGHSIVVSGAAVIVAMAGLFVVQDPTFASLATGAILVVAISVLGSLTVLPALLAKLGRWVDRPRVPLLWRANRRIGRGGISRRLLGPVVRRPKTALLISTVAVAGLAAPALGMSMHEANINTLPQDIAEVQAFQQIEKAFPSEGETMRVVVTADRADLPAVRDGLAELRQAAEAGNDFATSPGDAIDESADGTTAMLTLSTSYAEGAAGNDRALDQVRDTLAPRYLGDVSGAEWAVGGGIATAADSLDHQTSKLPYVIGFVLALTLLMMGITFRSVTIALVTTVLNLASVAASFGVLTLVFQNTWAEGLLDFKSSGFVVDWIPLFMFVVLVGLSMDYHVFVLSRIRENIARGLPPRLAVETGVSETAGVVTSAATVMVSVFAVFATLSMLEMKQMGVGLAVAVLVDATLIRVVMLPAMLIMLGRLAWWPGTSTAPELVPVVEPAQAPALVGTA